MLNIFHKFAVSTLLIIIIIFVFACGGDDGASTSNEFSFLGSWKLDTVTDLSDFRYNAGETIQAPQHWQLSGNVLVTANGTLIFTQDRFVLQIDFTFEQDFDSFVFSDDVSGDYVISGSTVTIIMDSGRSVIYRITTRNNKVVIVDENFEFWKESVWEKVV